jgi:hypothetical protein
LLKPVRSLLTRGGLHSRPRVTRLALKTSYVIYAMAVHSIGAVNVPELQVRFDDDGHMTEISCRWEGCRWYAVRFPERPFLFWSPYKPTSMFSPYPHYENTLTPEEAIHSNRAGKFHAGIGKKDYEYDDYPKSNIAIADESGMFTAQEVKDDEKVEEEVKDDEEVKDEKAEEVMDDEEDKDADNDDGPVALWLTPYVKALYKKKDEEDKKKDEEDWAIVGAGVGAASSSSGGTPPPVSWKPVSWKPKKLKGMQALREELRLCG